MKTEKKIWELEQKVKDLEKQVKKSKNDDDEDGACCCCIATLAGAFIVGTAVGAPQDLSKASVDEERVEMVAEQPNYFLRQIDNYQKNISPKLKEQLNVQKICRYEPTCSQYAKEAIQKYGSAKGSALATKRLLKCNPLSKGGYDPVK